MIRILNCRLIFCATLSYTRWTVKLRLLVFLRNDPIEDLMHHTDELLLRCKSSVNDNDDVTQISFPEQNLVNEIM